MSCPKEAIISSLTWIHSCSIIQKAKHKSSSKVLSPFCKRSNCHYGSYLSEGGNTSKIRMYTNVMFDPKRLGKQI